ncbi:MAG: hypothetical protein Q9227_004235 [Pyrenula ochraceoflavens]
MDPTAPSQPSQQTAYNQPANPSTQTDAEQHTAASRNNAPQIDRRQAHDVPSRHGATATASSLGYGDTGALKEKDLGESNALNAAEGDFAAGRDPNLEGEQMRAPGEGDVANTIRDPQKHTYATEGSLTNDMDRKEAEHRRKLHETGRLTAGEMGRTAEIGTGSGRAGEIGEEVEVGGRDANEDWTGKKGNVDMESALGGRGKGVVLQAEDVR